MDEERIKELIGCNITEKMLSPYRKYVFPEEDNPEWEKCTRAFADLSQELQKKLDSFRVQCKAAMRAQSLGLCKRIIKHAIEDDERG